MAARRAHRAPIGRNSRQYTRHDGARPKSAGVRAGIPSFYEVAGCGLFVLCLVGPNAHAALLAFKNMSDISAFRFHDRFEESEPSCAEAAVMV
jgi:hypothetical protein